MLASSAFMRPARCLTIFRAPDVSRKLSMGIFEPSDGTAPAGTEEMSGRIVDGSAADVTAVVTATETKRLDR